MYKKINVKIHTLFHKSVVPTLLLATCLSACSGAKTSSAHHHSSPHTSSEQRAINVIDLQAVQGIQTIIPKLATYRAVLVGENHTTYGEHLNQLAIIKYLHEHGSKTVIGLEFVQKPFQDALDKYVAGRLSELDMLRQTQWYKRWKYDFRLYRPIFKFARHHKIPLIALNVPTEITKRISKVGLNGLTTKQRQQLPKTIDKSNSAYKKHLRSIFKLHAHAGSAIEKNGKTTQHKKFNQRFERFYEAQLAWDEGMAAMAATYLLKHPKHQMVLLAGSGHMINRHGIPARLERRLNSKVAVVLNNTGKPPNASQGDFLLFSAKATLPKAGLLGVFMREEEKKVIISALMPKGAAKKAGIQKGDIVLAVGDKTVKTISDVKLLLLDAKPDEKRTIHILRGNKKINKNIILQ